MSFVVVVFVAVLAFLYIRSSRKQRVTWLAKLDLVGRWQWDSGDETLTLSGYLDHGTFVRAQDGSATTGEWRLAGHDLILTTDSAQSAYDLRLFRPGCIGLKDAKGQGRIYAKVHDNVVNLAQARKH